MLIPINSGPIGDKPVSEIVGADTASIRLTDSALVADTAITSIGTGEFTWEAWIYWPTAANGAIEFPYLFGIGDARIDGFFLRDTRIAGYIGGTRVFNETVSSLYDAWHHIAICRSGSTARLFVDGTQVASASSSDSVSSGAVIIGSRDSALTNPLRANVQLVHVTTAVKYTSAFTPSKNYGADGGTLALWHSADGSTITDTQGDTYTVPGITAHTRAHLFGPDSAGSPPVTETTTSYFTASAFAISSVEEHSWTDTDANNATSLSADDSDEITTGAVSWSKFVFADYFISTNFGITTSDVPSTALVLSQEVELKAGASQDEAFRPFVAPVVNGIADNIANFGNLSVSSTITVLTSGGAIQDIGYTAAEAVKTDSGVEIWIRERFSNPSTQTAAIERLRMRVIYEEDD